MPLRRASTSTVRTSLTSVTSTTVSDFGEESTSGPRASILSGTSGSNRRSFKRLNTIRRRSSLFVQQQASLSPHGEVANLRRRRSTWMQSPKSTKSTNEPLEPLVTAVDQDEEFELDTTCGRYMVDFVQRIPKNEWYKFHPEVKDPSGKSQAAETLMQHFHYPGWGDFAEALLAVKNEILYAGLMQDITLFWKIEVVHPDWQVDPRQVWQERALEIYKHHSNAKCLISEVNHWVLRNLVMVYRRPSDVETSQERHERKQEFWSNLHDEARRQEVQTVSHPFKNDLRTKIRGDEETRTRPMSASDLHRCLRVKSNAGGLRPSSRPASATDFDWKRRSARSKKNLGTWDWTHGSPRLSRPAAAAGREGLRGHWSAALFGITDKELNEFAEIAEDQHESFIEGEETFLSKSKRFDAGSDRRDSNGMGRKTMSLPRLRRPSSAAALRDNLLGDKHHTPKKPNLRREKGMRSGSQYPYNSPHVEPWHDRSPQPPLKCEDSVVKQYLRACHHGQNIPNTLPILTGHSLKMRLVDTWPGKDLMNITLVLNELALKEVDLEDNTGVSLDALENFFSVLAQGPASSSLESLSLKRCLQAARPSSGPCVFNSVIQLITNGARGLLHLDLTDVQMGVRCQLPFAKAAHDLPHLTSLVLCNVGLGISQGPVTTDIIEALLGSLSLRVLDLGWNTFSAESFSHLGECQVYSARLQKLSLCNCSSIPELGFSSNIVHFLQHLSHDRSLTSLDISLNHIDFRGALVIEDALMNVKRLTELDMSNNPLGVIGTRSLWRLLSSTSSGLMRFDCTESFGGGFKPNGEGLQVFRAANPGGRYVLELKRPYHRALLRMLYKTCESFNLQPSDTFSHVSYTAGAFEHAQKDQLGEWVVPRTGILSTTFSIDKALEREMEGIDCYDFESYLEIAFKLLKRTPSFLKIAPLFAQWKRSSGSMEEQMVMLDAMSKDFRFTFAHVKMFTKMSRSLVGEIIERLLSCVEGESHGARFLTLALNQGLVNYTLTYKQVFKFLAFNPQNPNGHYKLDLSNHVEYTLAERLLMLDRWESALVQRQGLEDISQKGNWSVIRNEMYREQALEVRAISEWLLPEYDVLEFDYSSSRRPADDARYLDEVTFSNILLTLQESGCSAKDQTDALRLVSHAMYLCCKQLRMMFGVYRHEEDYCELVVIFAGQVIDMHNEKLYRVRIESPSLVQNLAKRMGYLTFFPYVQPEQEHFVLNLGERDQRIAAYLLMVLAKSEDMYNLRDPHFILPNGVEDPLTTGIPASWQFLDKLPRGGQLSISYNCAPEKRNLNKRITLFEKYGHRKMTAKMEDILWWSSLQDTPNDVIVFMEFIAEKYDDVSHAFSVMCHNHSEMTLRDFEDAYRRIGCTRFKDKSHGQDEKLRLQAVFRFLDPGGEGTVSKQEFMILGQMFSEYRLAIEEFVQFCIRTFGTDLMDSWYFLDDNDDGEIDRDEWQKACEFLGYLGLVMPIFRFLDTDNQGTISLDEFMQLEKFFNQTGIVE